MTNSVKKLIVSNRRYTEIQAHTSLRTYLRCNRCDVLCGTSECLLILQRGTDCEKENKIPRILHEWAFHMKIIKRAFGEFHKFHMKQFCLSYDPLKWDFIAFGMNIISIRKYIADADVVNDAQFKYYYTCGHTIFMT